MKARHVAGWAAILGGAALTSPAAAGPGDAPVASATFQSYDAKGCVATEVTVFALGTPGGSGAKLTLLASQVDECQGKDLLAAKASDGAGSRRVQRQPGPGHRDAGRRGQGAGPARTGHGLQRRPDLDGDRAGARGGHERRPDGPRPLVARAGAPGVAPGRGGGHGVRRGREPDAGGGGRRDALADAGAGRGRVRRATRYRRYGKPGRRRRQRPLHGKGGTLDAHRGAPAWAVPGRPRTA